MVRQTRIVIDAPGSDAETGLRPALFDSWIPLLFLASGAAGLIYQVVWTQDLVLIFGNTTLAIVTTVTAFLAGLGIGSLVGAALGARLRRALAVYGLLEIAVGCLALLMPLAFGAIATVFRSAYLSFSPTEVALIRFGLAFVALAPPTILMGMSLPVLTRHMVRNDPQVGERIARLYGLNTLGAVAGSLVSGYLLIELIGLRDTTLVAVGLNVFAGGGALLMFRALGPAASPQPSADPSPVPEPRPPLAGRQWLLLAVTFTSGLVSLALELLWTRMMLQGSGSPIYVFIAVVAVFLIGVAGGSLIYERQRDGRPQLATLGALLALAAGLALVPLIISNVYGPAWLPLAVGLILPVTTIFGYTFPLTVRLFAGRADEASRGVGLVYAANTAGCVVGTVLAGFVLIPTLGVSASITAVGLFLAVLGGALAIGSTPGRKPLRPAVSLTAIAALAAVLFTPAAKLTYVQREVDGTGVQTAHYEDSVASVDVTGGSSSARNLFINGVGITKLTIVTKLLAYVPKAARPNATSMLNICFGMGSTFRSSVILGLHTTAVDLDPTVPKVMPWFYSGASNYLHNPRSQVVINDGRNYVRLSDKRYDLITVDPPPPVWSAGAVVLQDQEFYQEAAQRLTPGGVLTTYIPLQQSQLEKTLLRTFRTAFRYMSVVYAPGHHGVYIMGSQAPITFSPAGITAAVGTPAAQTDLMGAPDSKPTTTAQWVSDIRGSVWLTNDQVNAYTGTGQLITDDHPLTEYFMLHGFGVGTTQLVQRLLLVVTGLLGLLIIAYAADSALRRRPRTPVGSAPPQPEATVPTP
ncbi:MAG TPA: fused MFS/spermidine synthase [Trebonia sp.]|nr:fused MFS/spermidine synthase [Trebonia sp.]